MGEGDEGKELEPAKSIRSAETGKKSAGSEHSYTQGGKKSRKKFILFVSKLF